MIIGMVSCLCTIASPLPEVDHIKNPWHTTSPAILPTIHALAGIKILFIMPNVDVASGDKKEWNQLAHKNETGRPTGAQ